MKIADAVDRLGRLRAEGWLAWLRFPDGGGDLWAEAACAGCVIAGRLIEARDDDDLRDLMGRFEAMIRAGVVTRRQWLGAAKRVLAAPRDCSGREAPATPPAQGGQLRVAFIPYRGGATCPHCGR